MFAAKENIIPHLAAQAAVEKRTRIVENHRARLLKLTQLGASESALRNIRALIMAADERRELAEENLAKVEKKLCDLTKEVKPHE